MKYAFISKSQANLKGLRRTHTNDRPWGGEDPPMVAYVYAADRKGAGAETHLGDFAGILQVDGYGGCAALAKRRQQIQLAF